jgi:hypothetical protein
VHPGRIAADPRCLVGRPHRIDGRGARGRTEIAVEQRVVVDRALGALREHRGRDAVEALDGRADATAGVVLP